ncbi:PREDICTED: uncharacterized protein LOC104763603 [Camelina sativa]|uniref:Uncharacterized protein LOC104763603 n=1 Tax=Camelina sativa TaxID=90675 RepID=A0ABM0XFJ8_CAMSA|nr:PREDICTED: uncharacterized protein LOC104763603 [Camelina sativa]
MRTNPKSWCRAFHKVGNYCEDVDNNSTESFNSSINKAREKPFVAMLETIRRLAMVRIAKRSAISNSHTGICTPYVVKFLAAEHKAASTAKVSTSTNGTFEVKVSGDTHRVCLKKMTCTCQKWQICGIPYVDNNSTESFNSSINKAREKPFVAMLETIRRLDMVRIAKRDLYSICC